MDQFSIIAAALAAGASASSTDQASTAVRDAYSALRNALIRRLRHREDAESIFEQIDVTPEKTDILVLRLLRDSNSVDAEVYQIAAGLMRALDELDGGRPRYRVDTARAQGVQVGHHNTQVNTFSLGGTNGGEG